MKGEVIDKIAALVTAAFGLIAALAWKRVTKAGGLASIISGTVTCLFLRIMVEKIGRAHV